VQALRAGIGALDYWDMTPREVYATIDAVNWQNENRREARAWLAWWTAAMPRMKHMPTLKELINPPQTKELSPKEAKARKKEHEAMIKALPKRLRQ